MPAGEALGDGGAGVLPAGRRDRVLQVDDDHVGAGRHRLANQSGRSPGTYSQVSGICHRAPSARRSRCPPRSGPARRARPWCPGRARARRAGSRPASRRVRKRHVLHAQLGPGPRRARRRRCRARRTAGRHHVPYVLHRGHRGLRLLEGRDDVGAGGGRHPGADRLVEDVGVRRAVGAGANHGSSISSGRPTSRITRSAIDCADVDTATQVPSARAVGVARGVVRERLPSRGWT